MMSPQNLPEPARLKMIMQSLAALDAIYSPELDYRYYSFDSNWSENEEMGSIRNGSGDTVFVLFNPHGCFVKGYAHEFQSSHIPWDAFYAGIPGVLADAAKEPAFSPENVSFCCWRLNSNDQWQSAISHTDLDPDCFFLLQGLDGVAKTYNDFAADYYEVSPDLELISPVFHHQPMTRSWAKKINREISYPDLIKELNNIEYRVSKEGILKKLFGK